MKKYLLMALMMATTCAHAQEFSITCKTYVANATAPREATEKIVSFRISDSGKVIHRTASGESLPLRITESLYLWQFSANDEKGGVFQESIDRVSGAYEVRYVEGRNATVFRRGSCEKTRPKF